MPTPVGHTFAALTIWTAARPRSLKVLCSPWLWLAILSSNAPDLDFLPGLIMGNEGLFHRGAGHSVGGAAFYALLVLAAALLLTRSPGAGLRASMSAFGLFNLHLLLDLFGQDPGPPHGIKLLWPLTERYFLSPWTVFPNLERHPFDLSVIPRAVPVVAFEGLLFGPFILAAFILRRRQGP